MSRCSKRQALLNCAMWNEDKAAKAAKVGDDRRAQRLALQADTLREQAEDLE